MGHQVNLEAGHRGCRLVKSGTTAHVQALHKGPWSEIQIVTDTVFSVCTNSQNEGEDYDGVTFPAGMTLFGNFKAVTRLSGTYILYQAQTMAEQA